METPQEQQTETPEQKRKRQQHEAYRRWYTGPKGQAYLASKRKRKPEEVK
jgi:hypothetical protein